MSIIQTSTTLSHLLPPPRTPKPFPPKAPLARKDLHVTSHSCDETVLALEAQEQREEVAAIPREDNRDPGEMMIRILLSGVEGCEKQIRVDQGDIKRYRKGCPRRDSRKTTPRGAQLYFFYCISLKAFICTHHIKDNQYHQLSGI